MADPLNITLISGALGARVNGLNLASRLDLRTKDLLKEALLKYLVLVFPNQELTPKVQLKIARKFGRPDIYPFLDGIDGHPEVIEILKTEKDKINFGVHWHSDTTYMARPNMATLLYAIDVPRYGGDTLFANMYKAYDALSPGLKSMLHNVKAHYSSAQKNIGGRNAKMKSLTGMKKAYTETQAIEAIHPIIRTHPESGRKALYVNFSHTTNFEGMTPEETLPILRYLTKHAVRPEFTCRIRWKRGDLVIWDNRCTQHKAINDYQGQRRQMHRITLKGSRPK